MKISDGKRVKVNYTLKVDGEVIESSDSAGPLDYVHGAQALPLGLEGQLVGMAVGEEKSGTLNVELPAFDMQRSDFPASFDLTVGARFMGKREGHDVECSVDEVGDTVVKVRPVHPLAGKTLEYQVKILEVLDG